jgi:ADP-heptose:LPS heptosyltransferase
MKKLILRSFQSPGDILMLTAAVRDLHKAFPGQFETDVRTSADALWFNNPYVTSLKERRHEVQTLDMHYPLIHDSNQRPYHFIHGYAQHLEERLNLRIPLTQFHGDVHLADEERESPGLQQELPEPFWIVVAGGKKDFTAKWWNPAEFQKVVEHFEGRIRFVQCGEQGHWHPRLAGVVDLVGKTNLREFVRLMYHADGVLCPVTFAMHLAAAVETKPGRPRRRPCVVIAGGREPPHWEAYPHHQFIHTIGALPCCSDGGCWRSRCQLVGDGDDKDRRNVCEHPVQITPDLRIPRCMDMIRAEDVIRRIEWYLQAATIEPARKAPDEVRPLIVDAPRLPEPVRQPLPPSPPARAATNILIKFRHGLGDAVQLTTVLQHLAHYHPDWNVDVAALVGKHSLFHRLCRQASILRHAPVRSGIYSRVFDLAWHESPACYPDCPSTKAERSLKEDFGLKPVAKLCTYKVLPGENAIERASAYLAQVCRCEPDQDKRYPAVLIHYQGNTAVERKNLTHEIAARLCATVLEAGFVPVILDWDSRSPLPDGKKIHNPHSKLELWGKTGTGDGETLAALIQLSTLMIGVDSGPLHAAGATSTPAIGVWLGHHPLHYFGHADNVTHLVPEDHARLLRDGRAAGEAYFRAHYRFHGYKDLAGELNAQVRQRLEKKVVPRPD